MLNNPQAIPGRSHVLVEAQTQNNKSQKEQSSRWFSGIDSIRFILAFIVMLSHYHNPIVDALKTSSFFLFKGLGYFLSISFVGVAAVICFFIISGFVIHVPNKTGIKNLKSFYLRRYIRVLIPLIGIGLISIPFGNPESAVVWSLYCELIYYTIYPLLILLRVPWRKMVIGAYVLSFITIAMGANGDVSSLLHHRNFSYNGQYWQLGVGLTWLVGLPCWLMGVLLAERINDLTTTINNRQIYAMRLLVFITSISLLVACFHFFVSYIISLTLLAPLFYKWIEWEILFYKTKAPIRWLESCGKFSYSLYLTHPLSFVLISYVLPLNSMSYIFYLLLAVGGAYIFYLALERPAHLLAQRLTSKKTRSA